ncbi:hypothetical protein [Streptomyces orinoci]|uniref:Uncharacterized protein n=1 Tax=Streptomyces orinoci TaxID=67339 RepID=A0ABV3K177_STRON|nr:hypothetical protein [Streptomyces orinoci]
MTTATAPRWAVHAAHLPALLTLPSGLWRLALVCGFSAGYTPEGRHRLGITGWGAAWPLALTVLTEGAALLTLGLVRPWGEALPGWLGGRPIPARAATITAAAGCAVLLLLWTPFLFWWHYPDTGMTPTGHTVVGFLYLPGAVGAGGGGADGGVLEAEAGGCVCGVNSPLTRLS